MSVKHIFATRLRELREEKKLSQAQLAEEMHVSRGSISFYENEDRTPDIEFLNNAAEFFNVSADYLIGRIDVASYDTDVLSISKMTGLSLESIKALNSWVEYKPLFRTGKICTFNPAAMLDLFLADNTAFHVFACIWKSVEAQWAYITGPKTPIRERLGLTDEQANILNEEYVFMNADESALAYRGTAVHMISRLIDQYSETAIAAAMEKMKNDTKKVKQSGDNPKTE